MRSVKFPRSFFSPASVLLAMALLATSVPTHGAGAIQHFRSRAAARRAGAHSNAQQPAARRALSIDASPRRPARTQPIHSWATRSIELDGDPQVNVRGGVYPIDVNGNGTFELLHFNGYRVMRAYGVRGRKLWQVDNPQGEYTAATPIAIHWRCSMWTVVRGKRSSTAGAIRARPTSCLCYAMERPERLSSRWRSLAKRQLRRAI